MENRIHELINQFDFISLEEMSGVSFQKRSDVKYVFHQKSLIQLLEKLKGHFRILNIQSSGIQSYKTIYLDSAKFDMYHQHHNGLRNRYKIRAREYLSSNVSFLEIKTKNNKGITAKRRIEIENIEIEEISNKVDLIRQKTPFKNIDLVQSLQNEFSRITLVNEETPERITIDCNLSFLVSKGATIELPQLCILEIKRNQNTKNRLLDSILKELKIYPMRFSKYCIGLSLLETKVKNNRFKPVIHQLRKKEIIH